MVHRASDSTVTVRAVSSEHKAEILSRTHVLTQCLAVLYELTVTEMHLELKNFLLLTKLT
jgi:hypothetical protein